MKNRKHATMIVDAMFSIVEAIILAIIPGLDTSARCITLLYFLVFIIHMVYWLKLRSIVINKLVHSNGYDINYIRDASLAYKFRTEIYKQVKELEELNGSPKMATQYILFDRWKNIAVFIEQHFWDNGTLCNVITSTKTRFSTQRLYKNELKEIINLLAEIYRENHEFSYIIESFDCKTLSNDIKGIYKNIKKILSHLDGQQTEQELSENQSQYTL